MAIYIDARADESQREAIQVIWGGKAGGWMGGFAAFIQVVRGVEFATIEFEVADDPRHGAWRFPELSGVRLSR